MENRSPYSLHKFLFPFRFDYIDGDYIDKYHFYRDVSFENRVDIKRLYEKLSQNWNYKPFRIEKHTDYNQYVYFYDFVKDALFNRDERFDMENIATSYYFEHKDIKENRYIIKIKDKKPYELTLKKVTLHIFDTGLGILTFHLENFIYRSFEDVLKINDFGRRLYPQFLGENFNLDDPRKSFLPEYIEITTKDGKESIKDDFQQEYKGHYEVYIAKFILEILGKESFSPRLKKNRFLIQPIIDDRMFVHCWLGDSEVSATVKSNPYSDLWYMYLFIDGNGKNIQEEEMQKDLLDKLTYKRWKNYGTFYGITRYSFVCLSARDGFGENILSVHMKTIYYQMALLLLAQRASLIRFSDEITAISDIEREGKQPSTKNIQTLYQNYLRFVNKLYFKEITPQEQGIEMYEIAHRVMNIERDVEDLRKEISTINNYAFFKEEQEEKQEINKLTKLGTIFLPPTLIAGIFGMNVFPPGVLDNIGGLLFSIFSIVCFTLWFTENQNINIKEFFFKKDNQ